MSDCPIGNLAPDSSSITDTSSTPAAPPYEASMAFHPSPVARSPVIRTDVVSGKSNRSSTVTAVSLSGEVVGTKSRKENSVESLVVPNAPTAARANETITVATANLRGRTAKLPMILGNVRELPASSEAVSSVPERSAFRSRSSLTAGTKVSMSTNEAAIPTAASSPNSASAGIELVMFVRNPTAVVRVASTSATPTVRIAVATAASTDRPAVSSCRYLVVMWIE